MSESMSTIDKQLISRYERIGEEETAVAGHAEITVDIVEETADRQGNIPLAARVIVTASDGSHPDGSTQGVYSDGRFFADGTFSVTVPPGNTDVIIRNGPNYVPLVFTVNAVIGQRIHLRAILSRWFSPEERGWYSGDNHVHSQHDRTAKMKTGLSYTALQGRANGLSYITESGSHVSYDNIEQLSTDDFLLTYARELGAGCYVGHFITPGISAPLSNEDLDVASKHPFPGRAITERVHQLGGVVTYTHPLTPPHQLHWMGATEAISHAVLGQCADLFDVDSKATELLWFSFLNLGNKIACSSYTDSTLERINTLTPGDRRVYCHSSEFSYPAIIEAMRQGRTFATNGGPLYAFFTINGLQVGETIALNENDSYTAQAEIRSLYPVKKVELYRKGLAVEQFYPEPTNGVLNIAHVFQETETSWYLLRVEDERGNWCITSPIYFESSQASARPSSAALLFEISNHGRFVYLRREFFAHLIITVSPDQALSEVQLRKDGQLYKRFLPEMGSVFSSDKMPVTEMEKGSGYGPGWIWCPESEGEFHFKADYPVTESGWYSVHAITTEGASLDSDALYFDCNNPNSHELTFAKLWSQDTRFELWGYGEEMPLKDIKEPYEDRWWYPDNACWRVRATFGNHTHELQGEHPFSAAVTSYVIPPKLLELFKMKPGNKIDVL
ncbi:CehA/McbA family metallohydrolase [Paenibacillus solisilvae]|uniref:CehA/McbA family metallohydrolase n=1 Tax=Paenibacillus solisilvae TaxID=2486751 RepID=A0ABW0VW83_9BACL